MFTLGGTQHLSQVGNVKNFGEVWYNPDSLANILSMAAIRKVCRITMDTTVEPAMNVHRKNGTVMKFKVYQSGLYYYNASRHRQALNSSSNSEAYVFLSTVAKTKQHTPSEKSRERTRQEPCTENGFQRHPAEELDS